MPRLLSSAHLSDTPTLALAELNSQGKLFTNLCQIEAAVQLAAASNASLVVLPENAFCFGNQALAAPLFDALKDWAGQLARVYGVYLLAGTLPCQYRPDGSRVFGDKLRQVSLLFDPAGDCIARYDKIHLFKAQVADTTGNYDESQTFEAGDTLTVAATELGNIGLMVCYDLRFAHLAIRLREAGVQLITAPSAFTRATGRLHWQMLLTARALDSQCLVAGCGQFGEHIFYKHGQPECRQTWGHSLLVDANGQPLATSSIALPVYDTHQDTDTDTARYPLSLAANSWLPNAADNAHTIPIPQAGRVLLGNWQREAQSQIRQQLDLAYSRQQAAGAWQTPHQTPTPQISG